MSEDMGMVDGGKMAPGAPQKTHIDVHLHQESALAKILECGWGLLRPAKATPASRTRDQRLLVVSWVLQIVLGVLSVVLGGFLYLHSFTLLRYTGAALWTGILALLTGVVTFIHDKRRGTCWCLLRALLALTTFSMAIAAITIGADTFQDFRYRFYDTSVCDISSNSDSRSYWNTDAPRTPSPEQQLRQQLCLTYMYWLKALIMSIQSLLLSVWVLLLLATMTPLGLYCWGKFRPKEKTDQQTPLHVSGI
ncbi:transmembrane protein 176A [Erinaceus europaeus]|uniref:Transmembrane protein 176A n=1 Tax=Erinaceus europaeus TaxID=9365 RepID=A0A1S3WWJ6_ERIEU|nr:transmembrane protein 176A [Erinaceus europaeus]XP_016050559.1 transmembrane protein 176A [Erinaceus europaeus]